MRLPIAALQVLRPKEYKRVLDLMARFEETYLAYEKRLDNFEEMR